MNEEGVAQFNEFRFDRSSSVTNSVLRITACYIRLKHCTILYDAVTGNETESGNPNIVLRFKNAGGLKMSGINFINT